MGKHDMTSVRPYLVRGRPHDFLYKIRVPALQEQEQNRTERFLPFRPGKHHLRVSYPITMSGKTIVFITGANTGLGYEVVKALCKSSKAYEILLGSRSASKGDEAISSIKQEVPTSTSSIATVPIEMESDESIQDAYNTISSKYGRIDTLINNAGAGLERQIQSGEVTMRDGWLKSWNVNVAGTQVLTTIFMPLLLKSKDPRLMFVTSGTSSLQESTSFDNPGLKAVNASPVAGWPKPKQVNPVTSYRTTKTGLNMLMREWTRILKEDGVKVWGISPGFLATGLGDVGIEQLKKVRRLVLIMCSALWTD